MSGEFIHAHEYLAVFGKDGVYSYYPGIHAGSKNYDQDNEGFRSEDKADCVWPSQNTLDAVLTASGPDYSRSNRPDYSRNNCPDARDRSPPHHDMG